MRFKGFPVVLYVLGGGALFCSAAEPRARYAPYECRSPEGEQWHKSKLAGFGGREIARMTCEPAGPMKIGGYLLECTHTITPPQENGIVRILLDDSGSVRGLLQNTGYSPCGSSRSFAVREGGALVRHGPILAKCEEPKADPQGDKIQCDSLAGYKGGVTLICDLSHRVPAPSVTNKQKGVNYCNLVFGPDNSIYGAVCLGEGDSEEYAECLQTGAVK